MWVFDGEEWTEESGVDFVRKPGTTAIPFDETTPELQVIEIDYVPVPTTRERTNIPWLPLP